MMPISCLRSVCLSMSYALHTSLSIGRSVEQIRQDNDNLLQFVSNSRNDWYPIVTKRFMRVGRGIGMDVQANGPWRGGLNLKSPQHQETLRAYGFSRYGWFALYATLHMNDLCVLASRTETRPTVRWPCGKWLRQAGWRRSERGCYGRSEPLRSARWNQ